MSAPVEFHPLLVEEAVWAALSGRPERGAFHRERERLYDEPDPEARERAFARFHASWFERLRLADPVAAVLREQAAAVAGARRVLFGPAAAGRREGADLHVAGPSDRSIVVTIRPRTLADPDALRPFLRRELLHIADMLDPEFLYEPRLPRSEIGPAHDRLVQDRYRALWSASVDGRLARPGALEGAARERGLREFRRIFACLGDRLEECFDRIASGPRPTHPEIVAFATDPAAAFGLRAVGPATGRCPLCGFPTAATDLRSERLPADVTRAVISECPSWTPDKGICPQCSDLYRARAEPSTAAL